MQCPFRTGTFWTGWLLIQTTQPHSPLPFLGSSAIHGCRLSPQPFIQSTSRLARWSKDRQTNSQRETPSIYSWMCILLSCQGDSFHVRSVYKYELTFIFLPSQCRQKKTKKTWKTTIIETIPYFQLSSMPTCLLYEYSLHHVRECGSNESHWICLFFTMWPLADCTK